MSQGLSRKKIGSVPGFTPRTLEAAAQLASARRLASFPLGAFKVEAAQGHDTLWIIVRRPGHGAIALKTARSPGPVNVTGRTTASGGLWKVICTSGRFDVRLAILSHDLIRITVSLTPSADLLIPFWSRDLYPLGPGDDPRRAAGQVLAAQRGHNSGLCYFTLQKPAFGSVLYFQNLTALNPYFKATGTKPDGVVGGEWPELGYQPPTAPLGNSPPVNPLKKGDTVVISDAFVRIGELATSETASAAQFIDMLADVYRRVEKPLPVHHDWPSRAARTVRDLQKKPEAIVQHYGADFLHPYTEAEYPDSMVQLTVLAALREMEAATGRKLPIADRLAKGVPRFFDKRLKTIRRYLPNVGDDKNANAVDSWYLYHPLMNLARLAANGDSSARDLLLQSTDYAIRAAQHFDYRWPIQFDIRNFAVLTPARDDRGLGQTDVGGLYAYLMLQLHDLTQDERYLAEARAALNAARGVRFELVYQTNLTAWGAVACVRLWKLDEDARWLDLSQVFVAGFLHNCELWDSQIENARHYTNFFGATCLHDGPYMSAFECSESFAAFDELLAVGGDDLPPAMRLLLLEYRRFTLMRGWWWFPDALPPEALAKDKIRNGHIDRRLSFPLEDIYGDGQPAGQVGQEIYGCAGALIFAARAFHSPAGAPFRIFTPYPASVTRVGRRLIEVRMKAPKDGAAQIVLAPKNGHGLPRLSVRCGKDRPIRGRSNSPQRVYDVEATAPIRLSWRPAL